MTQTNDKACREAMAWQELTETLRQALVVCDEFKRDLDGDMTWWPIVIETESRLKIALEYARKGEDMGEPSIHPDAEAKAEGVCAPSPATSDDVELVARAMMVAIDLPRDDPGTGTLDWTGNDVWSCDFHAMAEAAIATMKDVGRGEREIVAFDEAMLVAKALEMYGMIDTEQMYRTVKAMRKLKMSPYGVVNQIEGEK